MNSLPRYVSLEAQLSSSALKHLEVRFGDVYTKRGDGWSLFYLSPIEADNLGPEIQRLCTSLVRDVANRSILRLDGEEGETDCNQLLASAISFNKILSSLMSTDISSLSELPDLKPILPMVEMLYENLASEVKGGMQMVKDFPNFLCSCHARFDMIMLQRVCVSAYSNANEIVFPLYEVKNEDSEGILGSSFLNVSTDAPTKTDEVHSKIWVNVRAFAHALSSYASNAIENELPLQWRAKSFNITEAMEVLKAVYQRLVNYWNASSKNERHRVGVVSLLSIVSGDLREYIKTEMMVYSSDWSAPWRMDLDKVTAAKNLCKEWREMMPQLQKKDWKGWDGETYFDDSFDIFTERIRDVARIRELLACMVNLKEKIPDSLLPESIFENVDGLGSLSSSETAKKWKNCVAAFEKELSFLIPQLRSRMKQLVGSSSADNQLRVFQNYSTLIRYPAMLEFLEREVNSTFEYFHKNLETIHSRYESSMRKCTKEIQKIRATRSCQAEVASVPQCAARIFGQSPSLEKLLQAAKSLIEDVQKTEMTILEEWKASLSGKVEKIAGITDAVVIEVEGSDPNQALRCSTNPSIMEFLQEARYFVIYAEDARSFSFSFSDSALNTLKASEKLFEVGIKMHQSVSNFNTVVRQAIPCTRRMLGTSIQRAFQQIFYDEQKLVIAFGNYQELQGLYMRFQNCVEALSADIRCIHRFHNEFLTQVTALYNVDLNKNMDQWRTLVDSMRVSFDYFLVQYHFENYKEWRQYLDCQIFKALEYQYRRGLETLHQNMEQFNTELVFKQGTIQFKPSFETLREAYYVKVREFVSVPLRFRGLQPKREGNEKYDIYPNMPLLNSARIVAIHSKSIVLFSKLQQLKKALRSHVLIGLCGTNDSADLDTIVEEWLKGGNKFSEAFQLVKERFAKLSKIEDVKKIDCFAVSNIPVKASIEEQLRRLEEALMNELRKHIQNSLASIDNFVFAASNVVERQPVTMDEVGQANKAYQEYLSQIPSFDKQFKEIDEMNKELRLHSGAGIDFGATNSRWDHFRDAMAAHNSVIDSAVSKMRVSLDTLIQKFLKDVQRFSTSWSKQKNSLLDAFKKSKKEEVQKLLHSLKDQLNDLKDLKKQAEELEAKCNYFNVPKPNFNSLTRVAKDAESTSEMFTLYDDFNEALDALKKEDWLTFRAHTYQFTDFCKEWKEKAKASSSSKAAENLVSDYLLKEIKAWEDLIPVLRFCRGEGWMTEHWNEMFRAIDVKKGMSSADFTFGDILDHSNQVVEKQEDIKKLHVRAEGEIQLRDALQELRKWALESNFTLIAPVDGNTNSVLLITEWKDVMSQVSDNQALAGSLKDSPFYSNFADEVAGWESKLMSIAESLVLLNTLQRKWTYLEPIFSRGALPQEQARFKRVDKEFTGILRDIEADSRVISLTTHSDFNEKLKILLEQCERCQKALQDFLEAKRNKFPRFYFISDEDLLEILGHSKNPTVIQSHLRKLYMGIHTVEFSSEKTAITHMISADGEKVKLNNSVTITDNNVEDWLIRLDESMRATLKDLLVSCVEEKNPTSEKSLKKYPSQVLQVAEQILFSTDVEYGINEKALQSLRSSLQEKLEKLTLFTDISEVDKLKVKALILDVIHNIEVVDLLIEKNVKSVKEWWWQKQLRYSFNKRSLNCVVQMIDTVFDYSYEYQGNAAKLVHTPLTDKCYLVLTKGMNLGYGGNPYGPAGTGKTESVKALGSALGRQVLVFNCDEGIDFKSMGRIFIGIVRCGAWGCFDEFNRLKIDQLSAISQMIQIIQEALKDHQPACQLLNREVDVNPNSGIFVTLNPAGKGYGGRTKLPDNLKQLFREVAMTVPDNELITSTMLLSEGFTFSKSLAQKIVELYKLCNQLMSMQQHYDWGLRPLKAVLRLGGTLVQRWKREHTGEQTTEKVESELILQSLFINTLSKLTFDDTRLFYGLTSDIFAGCEGREVTYEEVEEGVKKAVELLGLQWIPSQVKKVLQTYESMNQRMGVVLVGPSGCGKSTIIKILRKALEVVGTPVPMHIMNPKAMARHQLLGYMAPDTREWFDGVLTAAARDATKQPSSSRPWIVCDGDIDPEWIESLNSVLDDNKLLTMPNGVRIQFGSNVNFIFETHSLEFASPATVSRMGVLYFSDKDIHIDEVVESLMQKQSKEVRKLVTPFIMKYALQGINEAIRSNTLSVPNTRMGLLNACLNHVMESENEADFVYSMIRGLGSALTPSGAQGIAKWLFQISGQRPVSESRPLDTYWNKELGKPVEWKADLSVSVHRDQLILGDVPLVKTVEVQRIKAILDPLLVNPLCKPIILVGPEGCGKNTVLKHCLEDYHGFKVTCLSCSSQTTSAQLIQRLQANCSSFTTSTGPVLRPKEAARLIVVIQNVNLPKPDKYGTVELHSFIQQLILYQGFYNGDLDWIGIEKIQIIATMNPVVSCGRYAVAPRLLAVVNIVTMTYPSRSSLTNIYATYWGGLLKTTSIGGGKSFQNGLDIAQFTINVYEKIRRKFEGEEYAHFHFCPRHLTQWTCNVLQYKIDSTVTLPEVLAYEASRIFSDCLPSPDDRSRAEKIFSDQLPTIGYSVSSKEDKFASLFASWFTVTQEGDRRILERRPLAEIASEVDKGIIRFSREFKDIHIPRIPEVLAWIARVDRVLSRSAGHLIVVGRPGVGRRDTIVLAAYLQRLEICYLNATFDYTVKQFSVDLRGYIQRAVIQNLRTLLIVEDEQLVNEGFLELINNIISSAEVSGIFKHEEMEAMYSQLHEEAVVEGYIGSPSAYFVERLRRNFRVALIMDNENALFLIRLQSNPGLLNKCELLWFGFTPELTKAILKKRLEKEISSLESDSTYKGFHLHREILAIHDGILKATPKDLESFVDTYKKLILLKSKTSVDKIERLESGLAKLKEAEKSVGKIEKDVAKKKNEAEAMQKDADRALNEIQSSMESSQEKRDQAAELQEQLKEEQADIIVKRKKSEEELSGIVPIMEAAKDAVSSIRSESLNEIRSLKSPPEPIRDVLEGVLALLGVTDISWASMRKFLGERGVKEKILGFNVESVTPSIRSSVSKLLQQKAYSFKPEVIQRASLAAAPMAEWVTAMIQYSNILERIDPLTRQVKQLEQNQREGEEKLSILKEKLSKIDKYVAVLVEEFNKKCSVAEKLRSNLEQAEQELNKAQDLLSKLSEEKTRWAKEVSTIREINATVPKGAVVAAAFITYLGKEPEDVRQRYLSAWCTRFDLPENFKVSSFLRTEGELLQFKAEGLPGDDLSLENAVIILECIRTPLVVDPANRAVDWVRQHLSSKNTVVEVISMHDERFTHTLELAIRFGKTLLVSEVTHISPMLFPILRSDLASAGAKKTVQVGNKSVDWQDTFKIILFTRDSGLSLPPGCLALIQEVNFSVTSLGLESQLLGITIQHEKPELEEQKKEVLEKEEKLKIEINKLEVRLLQELADSRGDLLENAQLISSLNEVKTQSNSIQEALQQAQQLQEELDSKREVYRPFAHQGALLFFVVKDLQNLSRMYQFGLNDFLVMFSNTLTAYQGPEAVNVKIPALQDIFSRLCFHHVSTGLEKKDRLAFGLNLVRKIKEEDYPEELWNAFVGAVSSVKSLEEVELPPWAVSSSHTKLAAIVSTKQAAEAVEKWNLKDPFWNEFIQHSLPEELLRETARFANMEQLLIISTFRPDRLSVCGMNIVLKELHLDALTPPLDLEQVIRSAESAAPILLITSSGADPSREVQDIAMATVGRDRFVQIALGGGQTDEALQQVRRGASAGMWIFLKNLHLVLDWANVLEKEICRMARPHKDFRLIITTEHHDFFPSVLLSMSRKIAVEPPPGVKQMFLRAYTQWDRSFLESLPESGAQMLFGLAWFHAVVLERRNFAPQGWIKSYEFSNADIKAACDVVVGIVKDRDIDWVTVVEILRQCVYGGRLENRLDERVLGKLVQTYFNEQVLIRCTTPLYNKLTVPATSNHDAVMTVIKEQIPDVDLPGTFYLPANADKAVEESTAALLRETLRSLTTTSQKSSSFGQNCGPLLAPLLELWKESGISPNNIPLSLSSAQFPDPMEIFFVSEVNSIIAIMVDLSALFENLKFVSEGTLIPSDSLREDALELIGGRMPSKWLDRMEGPMETKLWFSLISRKYTSTVSWSKQPMSSSIVYDLGSLLRPDAFFNALRQYTARQTRAPLVDLCLVGSMGKNAITERLQVSVSVKGATIFLQGAVLGRDGQLEAVSPTSPSSVPITTNLTVGWIEKEKIMKTSSVFAKVPVFNSIAREKHIFDIFVLCKDESQETVLFLGGVAAFISTL